MSFNSDIPVFGASVSGVTATSSQVYYIDFNSDISMVWDTSCKIISTNGTEVGLCSEEPVNAELDFSNNENLPLISENNQINVNGYVAKASLYESEVCIISNCRLQQIYAVTSVS
jgi:hypothetical protein